jgi:hypothetical protein
LVEKVFLSSNDINEMRKRAPETRKRKPSHNTLDSQKVIGFTPVIS